MLLILITVLLCIGPALNAQTGGNPTSPGLSGTLTLPPGDLPVRIKSSFHLLEVNGIDDQAETFRFSGVLTLTWKDSRQAFDPQTEGVDEMFFHGEYQFNELAPAWYPQVMLANAVDISDPQGVLLRTRHDGTTTLTQAITAEARSDTDLRKYPFDKQQLEAVFVVFGFDSEHVSLVLEPDPATIEPSILNLPEWEMTEVSASTRAMEAPFAGASGQSSALVLTIAIERQPFFMMRLVVLPLVLIVILSFSIFWMDQSSLGDRMSVSFVGILTAVAYQTMVSDIMPQIAYITWMNAFLNLSFIVMCLTVFINLRVGALDKSGRIQAGQRLDKRCRWLFPVIYAVLLLAASLINLL